MVPSRVLKFFLCIFALLIFLAASPWARADLVSDLKAKIDDRNQVIADLEKEIAEYQSQVDKTSAQAKSLKNDIAALQLTSKKLSAEIKVIKNKIAAASLTIDRLNSQIADAENSIQTTVGGISATLMQTDQEESNSFLEVLLNNPSISAFLDKIESLSQLNQSLKTATDNLKRLKRDLESKNTEAQGQKKQLQNLASDLSDKKKVADYNNAQTSKLLSQTKNQEATYQKILNEKIAARNAFEQELLSFESQLKIAIDPTSLPASGSKALQWPLDTVAITQYFGNTDFAKTHPQAYNGQGHNGIDLKASIGTPVKAALEGAVTGTGDTDTVCPNASWGRWILIKHPNGLSTLYAHLSVIKVSAGQDVATGEVIGYSGETGYATGPHLHFTVYATQGVQIMSRKSTVCQSTYTMPIGSLNAYLNPLSYL